MLLLFVICPGEVLCDIYTQEFDASRWVHSSTIGGQQGVLGMCSLEVNHKLLCFP